MKPSPLPLLTTCRFFPDLSGSKIHRRNLGEMDAQPVQQPPATTFIQIMNNPPSPPPQVSFGGVVDFIVLVGNLGKKDGATGKGKHIHNGAKGERK